MSVARVVLGLLIAAAAVRRRPCSEAPQRLWTTTPPGSATGARCRCRREPRDAFDDGYQAGANDVFGGYDGGWDLGSPVHDHPRARRGRHHVPDQDAQSRALIRRRASRPPSARAGRRATRWGRSTRPSMCTVERFNAADARRSCRTPGGSFRAPSRPRGLRPTSRGAGLVPMPSSAIVSRARRRPRASSDSHSPVLRPRLRPASRGQLDHARLVEQPQAAQRAVEDDRATARLSCGAMNASTGRKVAQRSPARVRSPSSKHRQPVRSSPTSTTSVPPGPVTRHYASARLSFAASWSGRRAAALS